MQKSISLSLVACLALCGCGAFRRSSTWATVTSARINTRHEADPSKAYAAQLSRTLQSASVEHKVVTYQYRYRTRLREEAIGTRTAVIYRDNTNAKNPWWLMDDRLNKPVWLPGQELNRQVSFYLRDSAEVIETRDVHGAVENKTMLASAPAASMLARHVKPQPMRSLETKGIARIAAVRKTERSPVLVARAQRKTPTPPIAMVQPRVWLRPARFAPVAAAPAAEPLPEPIAAESVAPMFRSRHGTTFDPSSAVDRRKMEELRDAGDRLEVPERAF